MLKRGIVVDCGPWVKTGDGPGDQIALGRMKIAARWIDPERPTRTPRLLPGGERERIEKELGDRDTVQRSSGDVTEGERRLIAWLRPHREEIERQPSGAFESAERIGLSVPIHVAEGGGEPKRPMLRALVIRERQVQRRGKLRRPLEIRAVARFRRLRGSLRGHPAHLHRPYLAATRSRSATGSVAD
jgi:hypothetical protein